jgi:hypothetical protein
MRLTYIALSSLIVFTATPAVSQVQYSVQGAISPRVASDPMPPAIAFSLYKKQMIALRSEALELTQQDGGTMSADNRQTIQQKIDVAERVFHRRVRDFNPYTYRRPASARP